MPDNALRINKMKCILLTAEKLRTQRKIILLDIIFINIHIYKQSSFLAITFSKNDILKELFDILIIRLMRCIEKPILYYLFDKYDLNSNSRLHTSLENN